jgi:hypothetical protein
MDTDEMKVYIDTLEKENAILKERNDKLYELNCNQARMLSGTIGDVLGRYSHMVRYDNFNSAKNVYNQIVCNGTSSTSMPVTINFI